MPAIVAKIYNYKMYVAAVVVSSIVFCNRFKVNVISIPNSHGYKFTIGHAFRIELLWVKCFTFLFVIFLRAACSKYPLKGTPKNLCAETTCICAP